MEKPQALENSVRMGDYIRDVERWLGHAQANVNSGNRKGAITALLNAGEALDKAQAIVVTGKES